MFYPENVVIFLNFASSAAALVFYLPGVFTHTDTKGKQRKARVRNILKSLEKTQYLINSLYFSAIAGYLQLLLQGLLRKFLVEYILGLITETRILTI